ncbi:MAG: hypothetical protein ACSHX6_01105 [Akkermansiaceae bacterium]
MEAIAELIGSIISFILEVTLLLIELAVALLIPSRRASLKEKWNKSTLQRIEIISSSLALLTLIIGAIYLTLKLTGCSSTSTPQVPTPQPTENTSQTSTTIHIEASSDLKQKAKDKAIELLKQKWKNRE